jgi:hypothetical protein
MSFHLFVCSPIVTVNLSAKFEASMAQSGVVKQVGLAMAKDEGSERFVTVGQMLTK